MSSAGMRYEHHYLEDEQRHYRIEEKRLEGKDVGYDLNRDGFAVVYADQQTFAVPVQYVLSVEMCQE